MEVFVVPFAIVHFIDYAFSLALILFGAYGMWRCVWKRKKEDCLEEMELNKWFQYTGIREAGIALLGSTGFDHDLTGFGIEEIDSVSEEDLLELIGDNGEVILPVNSSSILVRWNPELMIKG